MSKPAKPAKPAKPETPPDATITLYARTPNANGDIPYNREGVKASVYLNRRMLVKGAPMPETLTITASEAVFRTPGPVKTAAELEEDAKRAAERAERAAKRAKDAAERAAKAKQTQKPAA